MYLPTQEQIFSNDLYSCGHNLCTQRPQILAIKCLLCAHKSGKDLRRDQGMSSESFPLLAGYSLIPMEKPVNWLRFPIARVEEGRQTRLNIQLYLWFRKILLQIGLVCGLYEPWKILFPGSIRDPPQTPLSWMLYTAFENPCKLSGWNQKQNYMLSFQLRNFFSLRIGMWFGLCHKSVCKISSQTFVTKWTECSRLWPPRARTPLAGEALFYQEHLVTRWVTLNRTVLYTQSQLNWRDCMWDTSEPQSPPRNKGLSISLFVHLFSVASCRCFGQSGAPQFVAQSRRAPLLGFSYLRPHTHPLPLVPLHILII